MHIFELILSFSIILSKAQETINNENIYSICYQSGLFQHLKEIPIYYINLDNAIQRKKRFLTNFGCLNPIRIPGVNASDYAYLSHTVINQISDVPGLIDELHDGIWNGKSQIVNSDIDNPRFLGALGCTLSHLKTALLFQNTGQEYALVLEDDASPELSNMWYGNIPGWIGSVGSDWSALQLSAVGSLFFWSSRFEAAENYTARQVVVQEKWLTSTIAYLISKRGARELLDLFYDYNSGKFDLSKLKCINADMCLMRHFKNAYSKLPPHFIPYLNNEDSSIIKGSKNHLEKQRDLIEISRVFTKHWYKVYYEPWKTPRFITEVIQ